MTELPPFFIIGNPRSGTTLLRLLLTSHSKLEVPPESSFIVWLYSKYSDFKYSGKSLTSFVDDLLASRKFEYWGVERKKLLEYLQSRRPNNYAGLIFAVYLYYAEVKGKSIVKWGDKNNYYLHHVDKLAELFPGALFIHIIRDGRDVACSYREIMKKEIKSRYAPKLPVNLPDIAREWAGNIKAVEASFSKIGTGATISVRYEDLVREPESILMKVCNFLDVSYEERMLEYYKMSETEGFEPTEFMSWKWKNKSPIFSNELKKFRHLLSDEQIKTFNSIAGEVLSRYNYNLT